MLINSCFQNLQEILELFYQIISNLWNIVYFNLDVREYKDKTKTEILFQMLVVQIERFNCASFIASKNYKYTDYNGCYEQQMYFEITSLNFFFLFSFTGFRVGCIRRGIHNRTLVGSYLQSQRS